MTFKILFWHSNCVGKSYSKSNFYILTVSENRTLTIKILFWHSDWVGKCYFGIQNSILTFGLSREMLFWHSKSFFDIRTQWENRIFIFKILFWNSNWVGKSYSKSYFDIPTESENRILTFKILFRHSNWVGKCSFGIQSHILTFELNCKMLFSYSKSYFDIYM